MKEYKFSKPVIQFECYKTKEVEERIEKTFEYFNKILPESKDAKIVLKPNFNNDLNSLIGNSTDLRVLISVIKVLQKRKYKNITILEGPNCGINHMKIEVFKRLRITDVAKKFKVNLINANKTDFKIIQLTKPAKVSKVLFDADFVISLPKIKTHIEAGLTLSLKNMMGCLQALDKRVMHYKLLDNIVKLNEQLPVDLVIMDGLVAMEGNGPGDGLPKRLDTILACEDRFIMDLLISKLVNFDYNKIKYLKIAVDKNLISQHDLNYLSMVGPMYFLKKPGKNILADILLKNIFVLPRYWKPLDPFFSKGPIPWILFKLGVRQDTYDKKDAEIEKLYFKENFDLDMCPLQLKDPENEDCIKCLYCYMHYPEKIGIEGDLGYLKIQFKRFSKYFKNLHK